MSYYNFVGSMSVNKIGKFLEENRVDVDRDMVKEKFVGNGIYEVKIGRVDCGVFGMRRCVKEVVKRESIGVKKGCMYVELFEEIV